jgi:hypothetical protein
VIAVILALMPFVMRFFRGHIERPNEIHELKNFENLILEKSNEIKLKTVDDKDFVFSPIQPEKSGTSYKVHAVILSESPEAKMGFILVGNLKIMSYSQNPEKKGRFNLTIEELLQSTQSLCALNTGRQIPNYYTMEMSSQYTLVKCKGSWDTFSGEFCHLESHEGLHFYFLYDNYFLFRFLFFNIFSRLNFVFL